MEKLRLKAVLLFFFALAILFPSAMLSTSSYNIYAQTNATTAILTPNTLVPLQNATTNTYTNTNTNTTTGTGVTDFK